MILARLRHHLTNGELFRSFLGVGGMYMLGIPLGLAINILLARQLGPAEFGQYVFIMSVLALMALPASGGLPKLLTREVARFSHAADWSLYRGAVRAAHFWVFLVGTIVIAGFFGVKATGVLPEEGKWALLGIVILLVPLQGLNAVRNGTIKGLGFPALAEMPLQTVQPILLLAGIGLLVATNVLDASSALWMQVAATTLTFALATWLFLSVQPPNARAHRPAYQNSMWLRALVPFSLISLVGTFNAQTGIVLLGVLGTEEGVGVLRIADRAAQFVCLALMLVNMVVAPKIVKAWQENDRKGLQLISRYSARAAFSLAVFISVIFFFFGKAIIAITFGSVYTESVYFPMIILIVGQLFNVAMGSVGIILAMTGHEKVTLMGQVFGLTATLVLAILLIPHYGETGAAIAISFGIIIWNVVMAFSVKRHIKIMPGIL